MCGGVAVGACCVLAGVLMFNLIAVHTCPLCYTRALVSTWPHRGRSLCSARAPAFTLPHRGRLRLPHRGRFHLFEFAPWWAFMLAPFRGRWRQAHEKCLLAEGRSPSKGAEPVFPFCPTRRTVGRGSVNPSDVGGAPTWAMTVHVRRSFRRVGTCPLPRLLSLPLPRGERRARVSHCLGADS